MAIAVKMQRLSKVATTGEVLEWLKQPGDTVQAGEPLLKVLSEKATVEVESPASGTLLKIIVPANTEVPAGTLLAWIGEAGEMPPAAPASAAGKEAALSPTPTPMGHPPHPPRARGGAGEQPTLIDGGERESTPQPSAVQAVPAARRIARERGILLSSVPGTGPGGIITQADAERAGRPRMATPAVDDFSLPISADAGTGPESGATLEPLTGIQRIMMGRMNLNREVVAQATTVAEVDMTEIAATRESVPATYTAWVILAAVRALGEYPILNGSLYGDQLAYHPDVQVGVSVETDAGLIVPVIHDAQTMGLSRIHAELSRLVQAAREGALQPADVEGATFTVTNSGVLGSVLYTPMIVPPQGAILGMGRVARMPVVRDDQIAIRSMMYLCLSYDHRYIAGGIAVRYLQRVRQYLENPASMVWG